ncbi:hypothetical protein EBR03_10235, partial [bacterium]|nr:hypothetical protein [bacterium]
QIDLKRAGAVFKALCPFHDEKSPSFSIKRGDTHYHASAAALMAMLSNF